MLKFGLIPEFIGRLPVITSVRSLDRDALVKHPHRAAQRAACGSTSGSSSSTASSWSSTPSALEAIADQAMLRGTGARGLRAIMEEVLLAVMYEVPSNPDAARVLITREVVLENVNPTIVPARRSSAAAARDREEKSA